MYRKIVNLKAKVDISWMLPVYIYLVIIDESMKLKSRMVKKVRPCIFDCTSEVQEGPHLATEGVPSVLCDEATSLRRSV